VGLFYRFLPKTFSWELLRWNETLKPLSSTCQSSKIEWHQWQCSVVHTSMNNWALPLMSLHHNNIFRRISIAVYGHNQVHSWRYAYYYGAVQCTVSLPVCSTPVTPLFNNLPCIVYIIFSHKILNHKGRQLKAYPRQLFGWVWAAEFNDQICLFWSKQCGVWKKFGLLVPTRHLGVGWGRPCLFMVWS